MLLDLSRITGSTVPRPSCTVACMQRYRDRGSPILLDWYLTGHKSGSKTLYDQAKAPKCRGTLPAPVSKYFPMSSWITSSLLFHAQSLAVLAWLFILRFRYSSQAPNRDTSELVPG